MTNATKRTKGIADFDNFFPLETDKTADFEGVKQ